MKKLMTVIASVAMSFGLFAEDASPFAISFESAEEAAGGYGVDATNMKFAPPSADWTWDGDPLTLKEYADGEGYVYGADAQVRRTFLDEGDNKNYLWLETGKKELTRTAGKTYLDQTVKFTGFEEFQTNLVDGAKIAVWMSGIEAEGNEGNEDYVSGETNLYVTVGKVDTEGKTIESVALKIKENCDLDAWYRLTIKSVGNIFGESQEVPARAGFVIYVDGKRAVSLDDAAKSIVLSSELTSQAASLMAAGALFPAVSAEGEGVTINDKFASVSYQGIGSIDDITLDDDGPKFCQAIDVTIKTPDGVVVAYVTDDKDNPIDVPVAVPDGTTIKVYLAAAEGKKFTKEGTNPIVQEITASTATIKVSAEDYVAEDVVAKKGTAEYVEAELAEALAGLVENEELEIVKACSVTDEDGETLYSFTENTTITATADGWDIEVGDYLVEEVPTAGSLVINDTIAAGFEMNVKFEDDENAELTFGGEVAGTLEVVNGKLVVAGELTDGIAVEGSVKAATFDFDQYEGFFVLSEGATVLATSNDIDTDPDTGYIVAAEGLEIKVSEEPVDNYYTYTAVVPFVPVCRNVRTETGYETLAEAIEEAEDDDTIQLLADIELTAPTTVGADITLDLNGNTITGNWVTGISGVGNRQYIFELGDSTVTVKGGTVSSTAANIGGFHTVGGTLSIEADAVVDTAWRAVGVYSGATLNVAEGATLKTANVDPTIMVIANGEKTTLNINGIVQNTCSAETKAAADRPHNLDAAIMGSGNDTVTDIVAMNIGATAQISATAAAGIYAPNAGKVTVADGAKITGFTYGIYAKSGNLVINGGEITATADSAVVPTAFNDGVNGQGYAVLLETGAAAGGYANNLVADIQDGKFTSAGAAVYNFKRGEDAIAPCISGGKFKALPDEALLVASTTPGYKAEWEEAEDGYYTPVEEAIEYDIIYMNGDKELTGLTPATYTVDDEETLPTTVEVLGASFKGWYNNKECTEGPVTVIPAGSTGDKTFYAKTEAIIDPVQKEIDEKVDETGLDNTQKENVKKNMNALNSACGDIDKAKAWITSVYGDAKIPGAKLAATDADLIAISVAYNVEILTPEATVAVAQAADGTGFTFQIVDGTAVSLEPAETAGTLLKMVEFTDALGDTTKPFTPQTTTDNVTVTADGTTATAVFTKATNAGFMKINLASPVKDVE